MNVPDAFWLSLPPTIVALGGLIIGVMTSKKADTINVKADEIHKQGNAHWDEQDKKLTSALKELSEQKVLVAKLLAKLPTISNVPVDRNDPEKRSHHAKDK